MAGDALHEALAAARRTIRDDVGQMLAILPLAATRDLAQRFARSVHAIERAALSRGIVPQRYARNLHTLDAADQLALLDACVAVVGLGGLGGTVCEVLARMGVGHLKLFDGDRFDEHNLNRQLLCTEKDLGRAKAAVAAQRVAAVNCAVTVTAGERFVERANATALLAGAQVVVDCLDSIPARFEVAAAARCLGLPLVSAALAGTTGHVGVFGPGSGAGLEAVYGPPGTQPPKGVETTLGCLPQAVVLLGALECSEVMKIVLNRPGCLEDRLLVVDLSDNRFDVLDLAPD